MSSGYVALILHAHLPFVRRPEYEEFLEEDWLFEAITETYIPLIAMMQRLASDGVPFKLTMTITPTLCAMLDDPLLRQRYVQHLERLIKLAGREIERTQPDPELGELAKFYGKLFTECRQRFVEEWNCDLLAAFRSLRDAGVLEIIACAATHGLLPLLQQSPEAVRAQILIGRDSYREHFGADPVGFWLPECAYAPGLERVLQEANLRWFVLDAHGLMFGNPRPNRAIYAPCYTPAGPAAFARDRESSRQVWSAQEGYPGDPAYREFYRDIGWDLPIAYLSQNWPTRADRKFTGLKYYRVTGADVEKELYNPDQAEMVCDAHATHFLERRREQINELRNFIPNPAVVIPFDAELFGHWWFEGPRFLELFIRKATFEQNEFRFTTPTKYLEEYPTQEVITPAASSWGDKGYWEVWVDPSNAWIYPHLQAAARRMTEAAQAAAAVGDVSPLSDRLLKQLARELLLAQSSDWAFLMRAATAKDYAARRTTDHLLRFNRLHEQHLAGQIDEDFLSNCEWRDNLFPDVNWRYYL